MFQGYLTYSSIVAMVIVSLFGQFVTENEAQQLAVAKLTILTSLLAAYGRYRRDKYK